MQKAEGRGLSKKVYRRAAEYAEVAQRKDRRQNNTKAEWT